MTFEERKAAAQTVAQWLTERGAALLPRFTVCPTCGNKRCPKASAHWQQCSGSNDSGQEGSFYGPKERWPNPEQMR